MALTQSSRAWTWASWSPTDAVLKPVSFLHGVEVDGDEDDLDGVVGDAGAGPGRGRVPTACRRCCRRASPCRSRPARAPAGRRRHRPEQDRAVLDTGVRLLARLCRHLLGSSDMLASRFLDNIRYYEPGTCTFRTLGAPTTSRRHRGPRPPPPPAPAADGSPRAAPVAVCPPAVAPRRGRPRRRPPSAPSGCAARPVLRPAGGADAPAEQARASTLSAIRPQG